MTGNVMVSDPAPGVQGEAAPGLNTGLTEGAGDGFGCLLSPDKAQASVGERGETHDNAA